jgi:peptide/nickel transport system ATP-binding protein
VSAPRRTPGPTPGRLYSSDSPDLRARDLRARASHDFEGRTAGHAPLLKVQDLRVTFPGEEVGDDVLAVDGVSLGLERGHTLGIVGESGSGKSTVALSLLGLTRSAGASVSGRVELDGRELLGLPERELRAVRGAEIAMIFQEPLSSLHPMYRVGAQIVEAIRAHRDVTKRAARAETIELLGSVGIPEPSLRVDSYPHELSGGQLQRVMIAMALANDPAILIADEPTSALDVTVQARILDLLSRLQHERQMALVLVTHDLGVVAELADEIAVMKAGRIVEQAPTEPLLHAPAHPYTAGLLRAIEDLETPRAAALAGAGRTAGEDLVAARGRAAAHAGAHAGEGPPPREQPLLRVTGLVKEFGLDRGVMLRRDAGTVRAVDGVSFEVAAGETFGIVGESGSGKSTTARLIACLLEPTAGEVWFAGRQITALKGRQLKQVRRELQIVFQDPFSSLNPRLSIGSILAAPLQIHGIESDRRARARAVGRLLELVGLDAEHAGRYPHELSGGQRQRVGIARALALRPKLLIADEPVSALDVTIQAQILELLGDLQARLGLTLVFISHDLSVIRHMCDRVAVMHDGRIVELADGERLYRAPEARYTKELLAAVPRVRRLREPAATA